MAERGLPAAILDSAQASVEALGVAIREAAGRGEPIVVTGCGTSEHAAMAVGELLAEALPDARLEVREAFDAAITPRHGGVCLAISHEGGTRAARIALTAARGVGATCAAITARPDAAVAEAADHVVATPMIDRSWCHTVAYVSAILAGAAVAGSPADSAGLTALIDGVVAQRPRFAQAAASIHPGRRIIATGLRADHVSARELALKIEEGARIPSTARQLETLLHGHLAGCDADSTAVVRFALDGRWGELQSRRQADVDAALAAIGIPTVVIGEKLGLSQADSAVEALIAGALALQLLTLELAHAAGTNPDLIRREQRPYRDAAAAAES